MITAYYLQNDKVGHSVLTPGTQPPPGTIWLDMKNCSSEELAVTGHVLHLKIPPLREVRLLKQSQQMYNEKGALHLVAPLIIGSQSENPAASSLHFVLTDSLVITLREGESNAVQNFTDALLRTPGLLTTASAAFAGLISAIIDRLADLGEVVAHDMDQVSRLVFQESLQRSKAPGRGKPDSWRKVLQGLGRTARLNHRLIASLVGFERMLAYAVKPEFAQQLHASARDDLLLLLHDIKRLLEQAGATVNEANFLLDAIASAISIEQNGVIKIFSMVAVILMPPTMVASIYGMNFSIMPELHWALGYPLALVAMLVSGYLPLWWFRKNGWF